MAKLTVRTFPDPVLKEKAGPVETFDENLVTLVRDMAETMYAEDGVGLAAPQVGVSKRLVVIDVGDAETRGKELLVLVNPEIVAREGAIEWEEGCLSLPGMTVKTRRSAQVKVKAQDAHGTPFEIEGDELLAIALQHELDHLEGVLLLDKASPIKRRMLLRDYRKRNMPPED